VDECKPLPLGSCPGCRCPLLPADLAELDLQRRLNAENGVVGGRPQAWCRHCAAAMASARGEAHGMEAGAYTCSHFSST